MTLKMVLSACAATLMLPSFAFAHHSFAAFFDSGKIVHVTGKVTSFRFQNPHGTIALEVRAESGGVREWRAETNAPVVLQRRGWSRMTLKAGDVITIEGWPARDGKPYLRLRQAFDADGKRIGAAPFDTSG
jgi:DNA/RNA endonuclease YhcR with UshA esterase domain